MPRTGSTSLARDVAKLRIRDPLTSTPTTRPSAVSTSSPPARSTSISASSLATSSTSTSFATRKPSLQSTTAPPTRSSSTSLSSTTPPAITTATTRRRPTVLEPTPSTPPIKEESKSAGSSKTVMRRRLSVLNGNEALNLDGLPDPKQPKEAKVRSAKSPTAAATPAPTVLPSLTTRPKRSDSQSSPTLPTSTLIPTTPSRAFSHYSCLSKVGYIPYNPGKVNQDRALEVLRFNGSDSQALFAVFDGHGALGHEVSTFLTQEIPRQIQRHTATVHPGQGGVELHSGLVKACVDANVQLVQTSRIDCTFSGSTGIICWLTGRKLFTCNVGDSRAVLGRRKKGGGYTAHPLSIDQKPDRPDEKKRILDHHGRVESCKGSHGEDIGPARVWVSGQDVPGLAMSRSFGDLIAASVGVTARCEVDEREVGEDDAFIVLGSDGVWEFMSGEEVVDLVGKVGGPTGERGEDAVKAVVEEATRRWNRQEEVVDDITSIIVWL